jgi:hypothetical protein
LAEPKGRKAAEDKNKPELDDEFDDTEPKRSITAPHARRWVAPAFITVGLLGVVWLVVYYIAGRDVPVMNKVGDWNILIGMGLMAVSLGLSMLWK